MSKEVKVLGFTLAGDTSSKTRYIPAPYRCTVWDMAAAVDADPGDGETITVKKGATTVGVLTFGTDIAAGAKGTFALDSTNGGTVFEEGDNIVLVASALTAAANFDGWLKLDSIARSRV